MPMQTEDWIDLIREAELAAQDWKVEWAHQGVVAAIRNDQGACPLCALANKALEGTDVHPFTVTFVWALTAAFGDKVERFGAYDIADAADNPLSMLPTSLKLVRLALGQVLGIPQEKL